MEREGGAKVSLPELSENVLDSILYLYIDIYRYRYKPFNATKSRLKSRELVGRGARQAWSITRETKSEAGLEISSYFLRLKIFFISLTSSL